MICGSRSLLATICLVLLASGLAACATNPITGRSQLSLVSENSAITQGQKTYNALVGAASSKGTIVNDAVLVGRVRGLTDRIVAEAVKLRPAAASWNWEVQVIDEPEIVNAACLPGGKMVIFTGLIYKIDLTDNEIGQVMAHEVSHALLGHGAEKQSMGLLSSIMVAAISATAHSAHQQDQREQISNIASQLFLNLPNSREAEAEADSVGIELAARAGFDPHAAVSLFQKMARDGGAGRSTFDWLSTHPATEKRIAAVSGKVDGLMPVYLAARNSREDRTGQQLATVQTKSETSAGAAPISLEARACSSTTYTYEAYDRCLSRQQVLSNNALRQSDVSQPSRDVRRSLEVTCSSTTYTYDAYNRCLAGQPAP
jgi:predicted Zn-dependent protease